MGQQRGELTQRSSRAGGAARSALGVYLSYVAAHFPHTTKKDELPLER